MAIVVIIIIIVIECTAKVERLAGLNFHGFKPNEVFVGKLLQCLTFKNHHTKLARIYLQLER